eukprot:6713837-Prymnesium_polylepis.1
MARRAERRLPPLALVLLAALVEVEVAAVAVVVPPVAHTTAAAPHRRRSLGVGGRGVEELLCVVDSLERDGLEGGQRARLLQLLFLLAVTRCAARKLAALDHLRLLQRHLCG